MKKITFSKSNFILKASGDFESTYLKTQILGSGGYSTVYRVQNKKTKKFYACKELAKKRIKDIEKFKNEVNIMSKCDHPNIVKLYEIYESGSKYQLVMEECTGGTLFSRLLDKIEDDGETFSEKDAAIIFKQIISAINYCHDQNIVHRDLKMENVLFMEKGKSLDIKIIDFGLSQYAQYHLVNLMEMISTEKVKNITMNISVGTPRYVAPEVINGKYNEKCDIWSAGVILYAMLSGKFPFNGKTNKEICKSIIKKTFDLTKSPWENISKEAKDLISNMLCDENKRYSSEKVLNHPWLTKLAPNNKIPISNLDVKILENYQNTCNFEKLILTSITTLLKESEIKELKDIFDSIDTNKDGTLTPNEVKSALKKFMEESEINKIFGGIDTNNSNKIEYSEFISALLEKKEFLKKEKLLESFRMLDKDDDGKISKEEIKKVLNNEDFNEKDLTELISKFDLDNDGLIDYDEFVTNMSNLKI